MGLIQIRKKKPVDYNLKRRYNQQKKGLKKGYFVSKKYKNSDGSLKVFKSYDSYKKFDNYKKLESKAKLFKKITTKRRGKPIIRFVLK